MTEWVRCDEALKLSIAEINRIAGLHEALSTLPRLAFSDYQDADAPDLALPGVRSEDLTCLTYADASFALVLTSESLEHVPDLDAALKEIRRVLKPGGLHVFTIPMLPNVPKTFARSVMKTGGGIEHRTPEIRHPGGDVGYPVFTEFGADFPEILEKAGFDTRIVFGPVREDDVAQVWVSEKRR